MITKIITKSLLPAIKAFISNAWMVKQKSLALTGVLALLSSVSNSYGEMVIPRAEFFTYESKAQAARFLSQATMGADIAQIDKLAAQIREWGYYEACEAWIDAQFTRTRGDDLRASAVALHIADNGTGGNGVIEYFRYGWWNQAIRSEDQLRHRMGFALSQLFVVSTDVWQGLHRSPRWQINCDYYDMLAEGAFGSYRDLLEAVTYNPLMGNYLSSAQNGPADAVNGIFPDENYGREIMQLFSCGVYSLSGNGTVLTDSDGVPIENYTDEDIMEMAQVFTGLSKHKNGRFPSFYAAPFGNPAYLDAPMKMRDEYHDTSSKVLLDGTVLPAGQSGEQDISDTLDVLASHPSTMPYISRILISRLTSSNPSNGYVGRVRKAWVNSDGDLKEIIKAILLDPETRDAIDYSMSGRVLVNRVFRATPKDGLSGRLREPNLRMTQFLKFYNAYTAEATDGAYHAVWSLRPRSTEIQQSPTVFNFFSSDYAPGNGPIGEYRSRTNVNIVVPEMEVLAIDLVPEFERIYNLTATSNVVTSGLFGNTTTVLPALDKYKKRTSIDDFVDRLDLYLCNGEMPLALNLKIKSVLDDPSISKAESIGLAAALVMSSADSSVTN